MNQKQKSDIKKARNRYIERIVYLNNKIVSELNSNYPCSKNVDVLNNEIDVLNTSIDNIDKLVNFCNEKDS